MFILDSLMIAGIRWALNTTLTAAEAEMNDDSALRERLLEAEMRREMGEISDEEFRATEADLLARIREIRERREGTGPLALGADPLHATADSTFQVEAELPGDFYDVDRSDRSRRSSKRAVVTPPEDAPHRTAPATRVDRTTRPAGRNRPGRTGTERATRTTGTDRTIRRNRTTKA